VPTLITPGRWGSQKPVAGCELSSGHPLAGGMVGGWLMNEAGGRIVLDQVGSNHALPSTTTIGWGVGPSGYGPNNSADRTAGWCALAVNTALRLQPPLTLFWRGVVFNAISSGDDALAGVSYDNIRSSPFQCYMIGSSGNSVSTPGVPLTYGYNNGTFSHMFGTNAFVIGVPFTAALTITAAQATGYFNGTVDVSSTSGIGAISYASTAAMSVCGAVPSSSGLAGFADVCYVWNRALAQSEIQWLTAEPYAMWVPSNARRWPSNPAPLPGSPMAGIPEVGGPFRVLTRPG
jgi:hypothetical protein